MLVIGFRVVNATRLPPSRKQIQYWSRAEERILQRAPDPCFPAFNMVQQALRFRRRHHWTSTVDETLGRASVAVIDGFADNFQQFRCSIEIQIDALLQDIGHPGCCSVCKPSSAVLSKTLFAPSSLGATGLTLSTTLLTTPRPSHCVIKPCSCARLYGLPR